MIHRDLKPANVMLGEYGETLVVDWGLARLLSQTDPEATTAGTPVLVSAASGGTSTAMGAVLGTPSYMPPEQAAGKHNEVGPASDIFALGATLYAILTGRAPFHDLSKARRAEFSAPRTIRQQVPRALDAICHARRSMLREEWTLGHDADEPLLQDALFSTGEIVWNVRPEQRSRCLQKLEELEARVRRRLAVDGKSFPLAKVLQGGTWAAGRALARERRSDGSPPIKVIANASVF